MKGNSLNTENGNEEGCLIDQGRINNEIMKKIIAIVLAGLFVGGFAHAAGKAVNDEDYIDYKGLGAAAGKNLSEMIKEAEPEEKYYSDAGALKKIRDGKTICRESETRNIPVHAIDIIDILRVPGQKDTIFILKGKKWCYKK